MGVLYEHWDPIINECFYVGASWTDEDSRPYDFSPRNKLGNYDKRVEQIRSLGKEPEVRLIECSHLTDEELDELEILQIAYWKDLIGDRLTNVAKGGRMGWGFAWSEEMCLAHSATMEEYYQTPNGQESIQKMRDTKTALYASDAGLEIKDKIRAGLEVFRATDSGKKLLKEVGKKISKTMTELYNSVEGEVVRQKISKSSRENKIEFYQTDRGRALAEEQSDIQRKLKLDFYQTEKGLANREARSIRGKQQFKGSGNRMATTSEDVAQKILDFDGPHKDAAKIYGVSNAVAYQIKTRRTWKHLIPTRSDSGKETSN